jgi:hypothetical protein
MTCVNTPTASAREKWMARARLVTSALIPCHSIRWDSTPSSVNMKLRSNNIIFTLGDD